MAGDTLDLVPLDPRTPVLVGVGQSLARPLAEDGPLHRPEPLDLMVEALRSAAEDVDGVAAQGSARAGNALLSKIDRLCAVASFTWRAPNPALLVAEAVGIAPKELVLSATGGTMPQKLMAAAATAILDGRNDVVAIVGSEAMYSRNLTKKDPDTPHTPWTRQDRATTPPPVLFGADRPPLTDLEMSRGVLAPVNIYPLFENALRHHLGRPLDEHQQVLGELWSSFSDVASTNPFAWIRHAATPGAITLPTASNRMISEPYTKLMVANGPVDMGAAFIMCSLATARAVGVSDDRLVFPLAHGYGDDHFLVSDRLELHRSPAIGFAGEAVFEYLGNDADAYPHVDLYSCFPVAVELGANALGLSLNDSSRPLTLTGGLTFGGGPGNNYVSHSIAAMVHRLREHPGDLGLVTGLSYFASSHSVAGYSTTPPEKSFASFDIQSLVDATPRKKVDPSLTGSVVVETYTIVHDREGAANAVLCVEDANHVRSWGMVIDREQVLELSGEDLCGRSGMLSDEGVVSLD